MLPGYNTDVQHQGVSYHIQTEDNGVSNPSIVSLVYKGGAILHRLKSDYRHLLEQPDPREAIRTTMREQHRQIIRLIMEGRLESLAAASAAPMPTAPPAAEERRDPTLDDSIVRFLAELGD